MEPLANHSKQAYFVSLGCPKNLVDTEVMLGLLEKDRYQVVQDPKTAEVIIVNTCSFIQAAKEESIDTILEMADYKSTGRCQSLVVSGCLAQRYADDLAKEMPEVDLFIGTGQYQNIIPALEDLKKERVRSGSLPPRKYIDQPAFIHSESDPRILTGSKTSAYLKLSEGCNRRCAFCIIPKLRGFVRSRSIDSLMEEARTLAAQGVKELNLVAQDLTHYGIENRYRENLVQLLPRLCQVEGIEWIRLHYVYPDEFTDELIDVIAREPKIVKYLDMPIQHTNDEVLGRMGRRLTKERLFDLMKELRKKIPQLVVRTSIIVGFPGETESQFDELCEDLKTLDLDHVGVFRYSNEEGTRATLMEDQVPASLRKHRHKVLTSILERQSQKRNRKYIGSTVSVMVEGLSDDTDLLIKGRMPTQAQEVDGGVLINDLGPVSDARAGDLLEVKITEALPFDLVGSVIRRVS